MFYITSHIIITLLTIAIAILVLALKGNSNTLSILKAKAKSNGKLLLSPLKEKRAAIIEVVTIGRWITCIESRIERKPHEPTYRTDTKI